jgi:DNA-binding NtrC family response regulator
LNRSEQLLNPMSDTDRTPSTENGSPASDATVQGYVIDNMEGAVDQATFLARTDMPIAVVGPRGTGKMYVAKVVHQASVHSTGEVVSIDCREFRNRDEANTSIKAALEQAQGKTLVFKSPHLMNPDVQNKLARQLSTRVLADVSPPRYLPEANFVALFPDSIEYLQSHGGLSDRLASAFAGFPINVPPLKDRKRAVMRWAQKVLGQECIDRGRFVKGFSPDAEKAMLSYDWPGNITEMRQRVVAALDSSDKEWLTPVELGIYQEDSEQKIPLTEESTVFLDAVDTSSVATEQYNPTALEELDVALGEAVNHILSAGNHLPLGAWLADEVVLAARDRYRGDSRATAQFLQTRPRNISRWGPRIEEREKDRLACEQWREPRRLAYEWIREVSLADGPPLDSAQAMLLKHLERHSDEASIKIRAAILDVSVPTYQKRLKQLQEI